MCCGREGCTGTLQSCLSLLGCPSGHPQTCVLLITLVSALVCAEQNNSSSLLGKGLGSLVVGSAAVSYCLYPLRMTSTVGTEVSELVSPHPAVLGFEGQRSVNEAFPLAEQPRDIWAFGCIMVHLCRNRENVSEDRTSSTRAPGLCCASGAVMVGSPPLLSAASTEFRLGIPA